jgi:lipoyl(octanoyl) transferase
MSARFGIGRTGADLKGRFDPNGPWLPNCYRAAVETATISHDPTTLSDGGARTPIRASWLGRVPYREAWDLQRRLVAARADESIGDRLLPLAHPAVLTLGRQADEAHILASPEVLATRGIEVLRVERGGEVTYHGPGQLVAYPILGLSRRGLLVRPLVRALEAAMIATCAASGVQAARREGHPGCWCDPDGAAPRKIGALGLRVERGVSYHGIALNIAPDLADFELIDACGVPGTVSTSIARELGRPDEAPSTDAVERAAWTFATALAVELGAALEIGDEVAGADDPTARPARP